MQHVLHCCNASFSLQRQTRIVPVNGVKAINVPKKLPLFVLLLLGLLICHSCSKDGLNQRLVRVKIETNSDEPVRIYGIKDSGENGIVIKRNFESAFKAEKEFFSIEARCKDENTLITIKVWVNGKLKKNVSGNKFLTSGEI